MFKWLNQKNKLFCIWKHFFCKNLISSTVHATQIRKFVCMAYFLNFMIKLKLCQISPFSVRRKFPRRKSVIQNMLFRSSERRDTSLPFEVNKSFEYFEQKCKFKLKRNIFSEKHSPSYFCVCESIFFCKKVDIFHTTQGTCRISWIYSIKFSRLDEYRWFSLTTF